MKKSILTVLLLLFLTFMTSSCSSPLHDSGSGSGFMFSSPPSASTPSTSTPELSVTMTDSSLATDYAYEQDYMVTESSSNNSGGYGSGGNVLPQGAAGRMVVTSAQFRIQTDDFNGTMRRLEQKIAVSGSYMQQSDSRASTEYRAAYASMTIRVPATLYGDFKNFLTDLAELDSLVEQGEDVTVQYYDTEARLKVLQAQETRIKTFIAESKDLDEIFKIERELTRISTEIEQLTTVKNRLDNLTAYATVYVEINEITELKTIEPTNFNERIENAFHGSVSGVITFVQLVILFLIYVWPLLVIAGLVLLIVRFFNKRNKKRNQTMAQAEDKKKE
ncbi:MAG: DUF4349 domain-containing protein [Clostridiales bacterium]|nr:DUF4349 domain-containing protein [Clostridiales bacterium]